MKKVFVLFAILLGVFTVTSCDKSLTADKIKGNYAYTSDDAEILFRQLKNNEFGKYAIDMFDAKDEAYYSILPVYEDENGVSQSDLFDIMNAAVGGLLCTTKITFAKDDKNILMNVAELERTYTLAKISDSEAEAMLSEMHTGEDRIIERILSDEEVDDSDYVSPDGGEIAE